MRTLLVELRPAALVDMDLGDLVGHQVNAFNARTRVPVNFECNCTQNPPPEVKEMIYRIVQEAFNNISKYAEADHVTVRLVSQVNRTELVIHDDGIGFDLDTAQIVWPRGAYKAQVSLPSCCFHCVPPVFWI